ncbi:MAG: hypothetical protein ABL888_08405 [Pirellulaceae bacterium]
MKMKLRTSQRGGFLLLIVLVTIVMLSLAAYTFTSLMINEDASSRLLARQVQSKYLVDSGVDYARLYLTNDEATMREKGGLWHNPSASGFQSVIVGIDPNDPSLIGRFTIVSSSIDDEGNPEGFRYGLMDESTKINLNTLPYADNWVPGGGRTLLMALPEMTEEIADAIIDFIDADDEGRDYGAESSYYVGLDPAYEAKNGPLDSIDELLLIRGVTSQLLFGADANRNGIVDSNELGDTSSLDADMILGWANYLTLYSKESNLNSEGLERINLNAPDLEQLYTDLRSSFNDEWSKFIVQYRINGPYTPLNDEETASAVAASVPFELDTTKQAEFTFTQVLDLVGAYTTADNPDDPAKKLILKSPVNTLGLGSTLPVLLSNATTFEGPTIPGRVNVMQASRRVLTAVPGMTEEILDQIIKLREFELDDPDGADLNRKFETWLLVEGIVDLPTMRMMLPFLCTDGDVYQAEVVGFFDDGVGTSRAEVIIDTTVPIPRVLFWRDKSHLQSGYSLDILGVGLSK